MVLLDQFELLPEYIVVDGHVYLDGACKAGFGRYLYDALKGRAAVIGWQEPLQRHAAGCCRVSS